ncbi:PH domain-containing protein [Candidatus Bipolaricaulota bacterium]|nr:PH domain-containing protein [Candidatus Bipolaricaulota bacterium]
MKKFCEKCGTPYNEGAKFCRKCGTRLLNDTISEIIRLAKEFKAWHFLHKGNVTSLPSLLKSKETVEGMLTGKYKKPENKKPEPVLLVFTNKRILFVSKRNISIELPYEKVKSIGLKKGIRRSSIDIILDNETLHISDIGNKNLDKNSDLICEKFNLGTSEESEEDKKSEEPEKDKKESADDPKLDEIRKIAEKFKVNKVEIKYLPKILENEEKVAIITTAFHKRWGILVATDRRVIFFSKGLFHEQIEDFFYDKITSVKQKKGFVLGSIRIYTSGTKTKIKHIPASEINTFANFIRSRLTDKSSKEKSIVTPLDEIKKAKELLDIGVITEEEFEKIKEKYLNL